MSALRRQHDLQGPVRENVVSLMAQMVKHLPAMQETWVQSLGWEDPLEKLQCHEFPGGPVVRTWHFPCQGPGSVPGWGTDISQATWCGQKENKIKQLKRHVKRIT